jgi:hypothetical protein
MEQLDTMEDFLKEEQVIIGVLDQKAKKLLKEMKEAHVEAEAHVAAYAKLQVDLKQPMSDVSR